MKIAIIQTMVPHYREEFYKLLQENFKIDLYALRSNDLVIKDGFSIANLSFKKLKALEFGSMVFYNPFYFLFGDYDALVLIQEMKYITHWIVLLMAPFFGKKVILWGHGLTVKEYHRHSRKMPLSRKLMYSLVDSAWFYTKTEQSLWKKLKPSLKSVALGNTLSNVSRILDIDIEHGKEVLKLKYRISRKIVLIFCARFNDDYKRPDLLVKLIENLDYNVYGFIVIGDGPCKPDLSAYSNVYDFGAVYDGKIKDELFIMADVYYQPAWVGLSIVEAMAYGKPVFTFKRSENLLQCVEYSYIRTGYNGIIFNDFGDLFHYVVNMDVTDIKTLGKQAREYVRDNLSMEKMAKEAICNLKELQLK